MPSAFEQIVLPVSPVGMGLLLFCIAGIALLVIFARSELRAELGQRRGLLDMAAGLVENPQLTVGRDGYPQLDGTWGDDRIRLEVVSDSLVPRRLPQLWLKSTLLTREETLRPSIGVLARPIGTEFYSRALGLPDTLAPPFKTDIPMLIRGRGVSEGDLQGAGGMLRSLFADPTLKEIVITPRGAGLVRQIAQGDRGAHILYRQIRFPVTHVPPDLVRNVLAELRLLNDALKPASQA